MQVYPNEEGSLATCAADVSLQSTRVMRRNPELVVSRWMLSSPRGASSGVEEFQGVGDALEVIVVPMRS